MLLSVVAQLIACREKRRRDEEDERRARREEERRREEEERRKREDEKKKREEEARERERRRRYVVIQCYFFPFNTLSVLFTKRILSLERKRKQSGRSARRSASVSARGTSRLALAEANTTH